MADMQGFSMVRNGSVTFSIPRFNVTATFSSVRSDGSVLGTFSGVMPTLLSQFTTQEIEDAFAEMFTKLITMKAARL